MDDEFADLVAELKSLPPAAPSAGLHTRIAAELARPHRRVARAYWLAAAVALPLAAAVALLVRVPGRPPAATPPAANPAAPPVTAAAQPVGTAQLLHATLDDGLVRLEDGTLARRARLQYVDTLRWQNPQTNASLTWQVPREEVRLVPVRYQ